MKKFPGLQKLRDMGYTVRQLPPSELPLSYQYHREDTGESFFELSLAGQKIFNNQDKHGLYLGSELAIYAHQLPNVKQASMEDLLYVPF